MIPGLITPVLLHQEQLPIPPAFRHPMPGNDDLWCPVELRSACKLLLMRAGENICVCVYYEELPSSLAKSGKSTVDNVGAVPLFQVSGLVVGY